MKPIIRYICFVLSFTFAVIPADARSTFDKYFSDTTLVVDLCFVTEGANQGIRIDRLSKSAGWGGRRVNLDRMPNRCLFEFCVLDSSGDKVLYRDSKYIGPGSHTEDEPLCRYLLMPMPKEDCQLSMICRTMAGDTMLADSHRLSHLEVLNASIIPPYEGRRLTVVNPSKAKNRIEITILSEGYAREDEALFLKHARAFTDSLFAHQVFRKHRKSLNITAVYVPSEGSGISRPSAGEEVNTVLHSHYDSFSMDRLLTIPDIRLLPDILGELPMNQVIVLANSDRYGGSGSYNEYSIGYARKGWAYDVLIHEFAHSFARLGDEYEEDLEDYYWPDCEPDEPNITTLTDFSGKWGNLIKKGKATLIEGAGYQKEGVWRGSPNCLMRSVAFKKFCPVCEQAIDRLIRFYLGKK